MTAHPAPPPRSAEEQARLDAALVHLFEHRITFNQVLGLQIESVYVGVSGDHIRSVNSRGVVSVMGKHKEKYNFCQYPTAKLHSGANTFRFRLVTDRPLKKIVKFGGQEKDTAG